MRPALLPRTDWTTRTGSFGLSPVSKKSIKRLLTASCGSTGSARLINFFWFILTSVTGARLASKVGTYCLPLGVACHRPTLTVPSCVMARCCSVVGIPLISRKSGCAALHVCDGESHPFNQLCAGGTIVGGIPLGGRLLVSKFSNLW